MAIAGSPGSGPSSRKAHEPRSVFWTTDAMKECSKSIGRRLADPNFARRYFVGHGLDIGGRPDPLVLYGELFPLLKSVWTWDWEDGDAQYMAGVSDSSFDFVFASHCLEHLRDPVEGLANWFRILKPGGHLVVCVPDEDLYEQGRFPSTFNRDHKTTWTIFKQRSWSSFSRNLLDVAQGLGAAAEIRKIELIDSLYRYSLPRYDQSLTPVAECAIELIVRKRTDSEVASGAAARAAVQPTPEVRRSLNQYRNDQATLRAANNDAPPFTDETEI
jgi:SAM-dependent methyltransferase